MLLIHFSIIALVLVLDQGSKWFVMHNSLPYILNSGIAFSIPLSNLIALLVAIIVLVWLYRFIFKNRLQSFTTLTALGLIVGGAIGNIIDRIRFDGVIDFIHLPYFPSFNLADSAVTVGMTILLISLYHSDQAKSAKKSRS